MTTEKKIIFCFDSVKRIVNNSFGNTVWLKVERAEHNLTAYVSGDGMKWTMLGTSISAVNLDKVQPNYNSWVGTSIGLFAEGGSADFDCFVCKDGFSSLPAVGYSNYYGVETTKQSSGKVVTNTSPYGGWFMLSGVELGTDKHAPAQIEILASSKTTGKIEIWLDDLATGKLIAMVSLTATGEGKMKAFTQAVKNISGRHDVYVKFPAGAERSSVIQSLRFLRAK